jgi:hypothetical protein
MKARAAYFLTSSDPSPMKKTRHIQSVKVVFDALAPFVRPSPLNPPPKRSRRASGPFQLVARRRRMPKKTLEISRPYLQAIQSFATAFSSN